MLDLTRQTPPEEGVRRSLLAELEGLDQALQSLELRRADEHASSALEFLTASTPVLLQNERDGGDDVRLHLERTRGLPSNYRIVSDADRRQLVEDLEQAPVQPSVDYRLPREEQERLGEMVAGLVERGVWRASQATYGNANLPSAMDVWVGAGEAAPGEPLTREHAVRWSSMTKTLGILFLAWLIDTDRAPDPDASIGTLLPEFAVEKLRVRAADGQLERAKRPITWGDVLSMRAPLEYETFLWGGDELAARNHHGKHPHEPERFHYSRTVTDPSRGVFPSADATAFYGCYKGVAGTRTQRVRALAAAPLQHQPGERTCSSYGPQHALLGSALGLEGVKPNQRFLEQVLEKAGVRKLWFDGGQTPRVEGVPLC
jgi:hypothetical protein